MAFKREGLNTIFRYLINGVNTTVGNGNEHIINIDSCFTVRSTNGYPGDRV